MQCLSIFPCITLLIYWISYVYFIFVFILHLYFTAYQTFYNLWYPCERWSKDKPTALWVVQSSVRLPVSRPLWVSRIAPGLNITKALGRFIVSLICFISQFNFTLHWSIVNLKCVNFRCNSKLNHLYIYPFAFFSDYFPIQVITEKWVVSCAIQ